MDLKDIKAIIDLMKKNSITEFELERQDSKIRLKRGLNGGASAAQSEDYVPAIPVPMQPAIAAPGFRKLQLRHHRRRQVKWTSNHP